MAEEKPTKLTITHSRKPEHTHEAFIKWIVEEHIPLAMPAFERHGVLEYSLFVTPPYLNIALKENIGPIRPGWEFADFDCFIEYTLPGVDAIQQVMSDPDFLQSVKDQEKWVDVPKALVSLGYATPYMLNGKPVSAVKKQD